MHAFCYVRLIDNILACQYWYLDAHMNMCNLYRLEFIKKTWNLFQILFHQDVGWWVPSSKFWHYLQFFFTVLPYKYLVLWEKKSWNPNESHYIRIFKIRNWLTKIYKKIPLCIIRIQWTNSVPILLYFSIGCTTSLPWLTSVPLMLVQTNLSPTRQIVLRNTMHMVFYLK